MTFLASKLTSTKEDCDEATRKSIVFNSQLLKEEEYSGRNTAMTTGHEDYRANNGAPFQKQDFTVVTSRSNDQNSPLWLHDLKTHSPPSASKPWRDTAQKYLRLQSTVNMIRTQSNGMILNKRESVQMRINLKICHDSILQQILQSTKQSVAFWDATPRHHLANTRICPPCKDVSVACNASMQRHAKRSQRKKWVFIVPVSFYGMKMHVMILQKRGS